MSKDLLPVWRDFALRLQNSAGRHYRGFAILTVNLMIDQEGQPVCWIAPEVERLEGSGGSDRLLAQIVRGMRRG